MLQLTNGTVVEANSADNFTGSSTSGYTGLTWPLDQWMGSQTIWHSYPIYVSTDKTDKAIKVLKKLEEEKVIEVKSVKRFIELVEKIRDLI